MSKLNRIVFAGVLAGLTFGAGAQTLKPGLWEISNRMSSSSGEMESAMAQAQKEIAAMPADQRKMMEAMMAKQGVDMGKQPGTTVLKVCLSKDMVERNEVGAQQGDCKQTAAARVGNTQKFSFVCTQPPSSGEGQLTFVSPQAYTMKMAIKSARSGKPETIHMDASGKFLAADCGAIKPLGAPKN